MFLLHLAQMTVLEFEDMATNRLQLFNDRRAARSSWAK